MKRGEVRYIVGWPGTQKCDFYKWIFSCLAVGALANRQTHGHTDGRMLPSALSPCFAKATRSITITIIRHIGVINTDQLLMRNTIHNSGGLRSVILIVRWRKVEV